MATAAEPSARQAWQGLSAGVARAAGAVRSASVARAAGAVRSAGMSTGAGSVLSRARAQRGVKENRRGPINQGGGNNRNPYHTVAWLGEDMYKDMKKKGTQRSNRPEKETYLGPKLLESF